MGNASEREAQAVWRQLLGKGGPSRLGTISWSVAVNG